jgi:hypothetical protein
MFFDSQARISLLGCANHATSVDFFRLGNMINIPAFASIDACGYYNPKV